MGMVLFKPDMNLLIRRPYFQERYVRNSSGWLAFAILVSAQRTPLKLRHPELSEQEMREFNL